MNLKKALCLNMLVRNHMASLERCLAAVAPHIACWVIGDTGSSDGTPDFIRGYFAERGIPGELHHLPFVDFTQARNQALERAYASPLVYDYLLLLDATMELVVEDPDFRSRLEAPCYDLLQRSDVSSWNTRMVRRDAGGRYYRNVTREYLAVPGGSRRLPGVWVKDHAAGANRLYESECNVRLFPEGLEQEPDNRRSWCRPAWSCRDAWRTQATAASMLPGISFIVRIRNEEQVLERCLQSLQRLRIPHEIIVILHLCTDRSREIAEHMGITRIHEYSFPVSRPGYETLITPALSRFSFITYTNWCFAKARHLWCFKWDADHIASPDLIDYLNSRKWDDPTPTRIRVPALTPGAEVSAEPRLFNAGIFYAKYVFWEINRALFEPNVCEELCPAHIEHASPLDDASMKNFWRAPAWFENNNLPEAVKLRGRMKIVTDMFGPEPTGMARYRNPACDALYLAVMQHEADLDAVGINLWG